MIKFDDDGNEVDSKHFYGHFIHDCKIFSDFMIVLIIIVKSKRQSFLLGLNDLSYL